MKNQCFVPMQKIDISCKKSIMFLLASPDFKIYNLMVLYDTRVWCMKNNIILMENHFELEEQTFYNCVH